MPSCELLLAHLADATPVGCVALRPIDPPGCCEMKRLYVSPLARGLGIGRALVDAVVAVSRALGYREMRLDSLQSLTSALVLYRQAGFTQIPPYIENPFPDAVFLGRGLT
jgi:ribosomal protein S18 acetylase RimI-like enzyme